MAAWIGVASANHVALGRAGGFMQVNHGKKAPLVRIRPGDTIIYYSPSTEIRGGEKLQSFTAAGTVRPGDPYVGYMGEGFTPWRRDVDWFEAEPAPIAPLLNRLELTKGKANWGYGFRFGLLGISDNDCDIILAAMHTRQVASE